MTRIETPFFQPLLQHLDHRAVLDLEVVDRELAAAPP
jgi:hypothetical protein